MSELIDTKRTYLLIKKDIQLNTSTIWIFTALVASLLLLGIIISPNNIFSVNYAPTAYYLLLFIGGIWISSQAFSEARSVIKSYGFFTLPASTFEKFFSKFLLTAIIYPIGVLLFYSIFYWIIGGLAFLINGTGPALFNPLQGYIFKTIWVYLVFQSVFLLGSIYFRKKVIIKTLLFMVLFSLSISIITAIMGLFFTKSFFIGNIFLIPNLSVFTSQVAQSVGNIIHILIVIILPIFCWVLTYIRLGETEV